MDWRAKLDDEAMSWQTTHDDEAPGWQTTHDVDAFLGAAGDFLRSRPVEHTLHLTITDSLRTGLVYGAATPWFGWWRGDGGLVEGAILQTRPSTVLATGVPEAAIGPLVELLAARGASSAGRTAASIELERSQAELFASQWLRRSGAGCRAIRDTRLYRLERLRPMLPAPPGSARRAGPADRETLQAWFAEFHRETGHDDRRTRPDAGQVDTDDRMDQVPSIDDRLDEGRLVVWEIDGVPVSFAGRTRLIAGMVRVAPVYTAPPMRRAGFGAAVTAEITREALAAGAQQVVLFTDLANPTSNALYRRLGYREVTDRVELSLAG